MYSIVCSVHFDAAHFLKNYPGKCARTHGHRWHITVQVSGMELNNIGILIDFTDIKTYLREITDKFDHQLINEVEPFDQINPTAENLSKYIYKAFKERLSNSYPKLNLDYVEVAENPNSKATYSE